MAKISQSESKSLIAIIIVVTACVAFLTGKLSEDSFTNIADCPAEATATSTAE